MTKEELNKIIAYINKNLVLEKAMGYLEPSSELKNQIDLCNEVVRLNKELNKLQKKLEKSEKK